MAERGVGDAGVAGQDREMMWQQPQAPPHAGLHRTGALRYLAAINGEVYNAIALRPEDESPAAKHRLLRAEFGRQAFGHTERIVLIVAVFTDAPTGSTPATSTALTPYAASEDQRASSAEGRA